MKNKISVCLLFIATLCVSCDSFLEREPLDKISSDVYYYFLILFNNYNFCNICKSVLQYYRMWMFWRSDKFIKWVNFREKYFFLIVIANLCMFIEEMS